MTRLPADHPSRIALVNELHARPYAPLEAPFRLSHLVLAGAEAQAEAAHLAALCERFGAPPPTNGAPHAILRMGRFRLKWERHTEFTALTVMAGPAAAGTPFAEPAIQLLPEDWLREAPGTVLAAIHLECREREAWADEAIAGDLAPAFDGATLIGGAILEGRARFWGDFRVHEDGFMRFALEVAPGIDATLMGRTVQHLLEVETYRAASMLALPDARGVWPRLNRIDAALAAAVGSIGEGDEAMPAEGERAILDEITALSAEIEQITAANAFRLDAARAYAAIVWRRIEALDAERLEGVADLHAFMLRRYDPAMRSCEATRARLDTLSERATRAATLLRTRIDVALEEQNRALLGTMNDRAGQQLRLQETVEGFSTVAISYYAVGLLALLLAPVAALAGLGKEWVIAALVVPVVLAVWAFIRRLKARALERD